MGIDIRNRQNMPKRLYVQAQLARLIAHNLMVQWRGAVEGFGVCRFLCFNWKDERRKGLELFGDFGFVGVTDVCEYNFKVGSVLILVLWHFSEPIR